jgi:lon-related putative ATP-dependent protease
MKKTHTGLHADELTVTFDVKPYISEEYSETEWGIIGQPRAQMALEMGIAIRAKGYNLFVSGDSGTGRTTAIMEMLKRHSAKSEPLKDIAYVFNFTKPECPRVLYFPEGRGQKFKSEIHDLVERLKAIIRQALEGDAYKKKRDGLIAETEQKENHTLAEFERELAKDSFTAIQVEDEEETTTTEILPIVDGEPVEFEQLQVMVAQGKVTEEFWNLTREKYFAWADKMNRIFASLRMAREGLENSLEELRVESVRGLITEEIGRFKERWELPGVMEWIDAVEKDVLQNLFLFALSDEKTEDEDGEAHTLLRYGVNIIVDNTETEKLPVIREGNPTRANLFGAIESRFDVTGESHTNFLMIKAGSILRANGGYLILRLTDLLMEDNIWQELKRVLQSESVEIQPQPGPFGAPAVILKPEAVSIQVKVIIIGPSNAYEAMTLQDDGFQKLFKISAEFDHVMERNERTTREFIAFIRSYVRKENLKEADEASLLEICRHSARIAERKDLLSARFSLIADLLREADYWAGKAGKGIIDRESVQKALDAKKFMFNLPEEQQNDQYERGYITITTEGTAIGCVNGLAVLERGFYSFGSPLRITAIAASGKEGILNIDREVGLSGEIHAKGVLILEGFLRHRFSRQMPLSIRASVCIEQSYSEIEGDSASSAELYALLSAIGKLPLRQDLAATGSVNQFGEIQPVGGVTEKIESFYGICKMKGLTGTQGVILPHQNSQNLILSPEVIEAVREGRFHIYPIASIDEGMEILTGLEAGTAGNDGKYPAHTVNHLVQKEVLAFSKVKD